VLERDEKLEELLVKGENIEKEAKTYKVKARESNKVMRRRRCCCWFAIIGTILLVGVGVFLILWLWLGIIKF
jgi:Synaptobrevin